MSEHYIPISYLIDFLVQEADAHSFCRLSPEFPLFVDDLRLCDFLNKLGNLFHKALCGYIVRDYGGNAYHDDLVGVLLIDFCSRYMKLVLQLCNEALDDHSLFFEAVYPGGVQPKCQYCNVHSFFGSGQDPCCCKDMVNVVFV